MKTDILTFNINSETDMDCIGFRIDKFLSENTEFTRSRIQSLIADGNVTLKGNAIKQSYRISDGDVISILVPENETPDILPQNIPIDIIYEDEDVILVNKPKGMVVHPSAGHYSDTLVNALLYHCRDNLSGINGQLRPGIVHRIDKDTTGVIVACKNDRAHIALSKQLKEHSITRFYFAICHNAFKDAKGMVDAPIGRHPSERKKMAIVPSGKNAVTHFEVLENFEKYAYIKCSLMTGRTHQIRVHMSSINHPLVGDEVYCSLKAPFKTVGQTLHAGVLGFIHPKTGEYVEFSAPLPEYFSHILRALRN